MEEFERLLDKKICDRNISYEDLVFKRVIAPLNVVAIRPNGFEAFLKHTGKTGLQQKIKHLSNDNKIAMQLRDMILKREDKNIS